MLRGKGRPRVARLKLSSTGSVRRRTAVCAALLLACAHLAMPAEAKTPGKRYCFGGWCHRVGTLAQTETLVGWRGIVTASYYDDCRRDRLNPCGLTSSGAVFRPDLADNAASPLFPDGTVILAYNPKTGDAAVLRINSAGPYSGERKLDVSRASAEELGFKHAGTARLVVSVLRSPTMAEATYVKRRIYPSVPGPLGQFETFDLAYAAALEKVDIDDASTGDENAQTEAAEPAQRPAGLIAEPRLAVSPYLARELLMLRAPPRLVTRARVAGQDFAEPEAESAEPSADARPAEPEAPVIDPGPGLRRYFRWAPLSD